MAAQTELVSDLMLEDKLVDLWPDYPCLYDVRSSDFKNRDKRQLAFEQLASSTGQTVEWVKIKLRLLRNSYTKAKKPQSSGSARKTATKRTNWLVEKLQFLAPHIGTRPMVSNLEGSQLVTENDPIDAEDSFITDQDEQFDNEGETNVNEQGSANPHDVNRPAKPKPSASVLKRKREEEEIDLLKTLSASIKHRNAKPEKEDAYGRYVSESLAALDVTTRHNAQHMINNILFQAQMGTLGQSRSSPIPMPHHTVPQQQYSMPGWMSQDPDFHYQYQQL